MKVFLIIVFTYLLSVIVSFVLIYLGDYRYRRKCRTLYEFLFEDDSWDGALPHIIILVPGFNLLKGVINACYGIICKIAEWSKTINLKH